MTMLKDKSPAEILTMADIAQQQLRAELRDTAREYSDRIKQLEEIKNAARSEFQSHGDKLPSLAGALTLSPDRERLLLNPTHGL